MARSPTMQQNTESTGKEVRQLEDKVRRLTHHSDHLRTELFAETQRASNLVTSLGFEDVDEAESTIATRPGIYNRRFIEQAASQVQSLEIQVTKHVRLGGESREALSQAQQEINALRKENDELKEQLAAAKHEKEELLRKLSELEGEPRIPVQSKFFPTGLPTPAMTVMKKRTSDISRCNTMGEVQQNEIAQSSPGALLASSPVRQVLPSTSADPGLLAAQLQDLQRKYDVLREAKERAAAKHKVDSIRWKKFRHWMFEDTDDKSPHHKRVMNSILKQYLKRGPRVDEPISADENDDEPTRKRHRAMTPPTNNVDGGADTDILGSTAEARTHHSSLTMRLLAEAQKLKVTPSGAAEAGHSPLRPTTGDSDAEKQSSPSSRRNRKRRIDEIPSSETEDDSQAPEPCDSTQPGLLRGVLSPARAMRQVNSPRSVRIRHVYNTRSSGGLSTPRKSPRHQTPRKNPHHQTPRQSPRRSPKHRSTSSRTPLARRTMDINKENEVHSSKRKRNPEDYSAYKGRGRYAAGASTEKTSINAIYQIDKEQNGGMNFQYDEVVRDKERRKHLAAGDCECCHDYYEAVGPLPPGLQRPLWRSPHSSPSNHRHGKQVASRQSDRTTVMGPDTADDLISPDVGLDETNARDQSDIVAHKHRISRHRQQWGPPSTPPGYWEIGFPDTQAAAAINARAREMHEHKRTRIENEASRGGRYRKR